MLSLNRDDLNLIGIGIVAVILWNFISLLLILPFIAIILKRVFKYSDQSRQNKITSRLLYVGVRVMFIFAVLQIPMVGMFAFIFTLTFLPVAYLESLAIFDIPYPPLMYVGIPLYVINVVGHVIAVFVFYYALYAIAGGILAFVMSVVGGISMSI